MSKLDTLLISTVTILTLFGLLMIYDASSFVALRDFGDKYHYIKDQILWAFIGMILLIAFSFFDYHKFYILSIPILIGAILLLGSVFIPGIGVMALGARRWIHFGNYVFQPAEFVKLGLAIYLASWLSRKEKGRFFAFLLLLGLVVFLIMLEPDMGTASVVLFEAIVLYFLSGGKILHFILFLPIVISGAFFLVKLEPYRAQRFMDFLNISNSFQTSSYHVKQILIAFGMGGLTGVGLGNSLQKYAYLPETTTDSIFAIIAEEIGFLGSLVLILLFIVVIWRGFLIASSAKDQFGKLLAGGITSFLAIQIIINLGAQTAIIPLTGIPLPFISYGGSSLIISLCSVGILLNIAKKANK